MGWAMVCMKSAMYGGKKKQKYNPATNNPLLTSVVARGRIQDIHHRQMSSKLVQKTFLVSGPHELAHTDTACSVI